MWSNHIVTRMSKLIQCTTLLVITLSFHITVYTKSACIIIHGTWAKNEAWYRPSGDFFESVKACNQELKITDEVISFSWSGKLGYLAQLEAANELTDVIMQYEWVILIGHSHGATIGMISCENIFNICTNRNYSGKIKKFYALGAPVNEKVVSPNMVVIEKFYNLFSFGDFVQTVNGSCDRVFTKKDYLVNISMQFSDLHPSHFELHHPAIGRDLLKIDHYFAQKQIGNFEYFCFDQPALIYFYPYQFPRYVVQSDQDRILEIDKHAHQLMTLALFRKRH